MQFPSPLMLQILHARNEVPNQLPFPEVTAALLIMILTPNFKKSMQLYKCRLFIISFRAFDTISFDLSLTMAPALSFLLRMMLCVFFLATAMASYNISDYGAKADGRTDSAKPFLNAWAAACNFTEPAAIYVPAGHFLISQATFKGPCKKNGTRIFVDGTLVAPSASPLPQNCCCLSTFRDCPSSDAPSTAKVRPFGFAGRPAGDVLRAPW
ncbi:hypothetical protein C4D60_Mb09t02390 [Musa balbisiana]|uniref:Rhamnogalacturonase A/B/Epimerase-like pectate lyase domain-containing protein n=1 Tax=Musa balbisiana TaxID=52838 RepID=A0A4S8IDH3_MUSBA|nr:hypothetical protein C4D60_Mb09t02390 [Musa balbisiana]